MRCWLLPIVVWLVATVWLSANAGVRHHLRRERFLDALTDAPLDVIDQLARLLRLKRRGCARSRSRTRVL